MKNEKNKIYSVLVEDIWHQPITDPDDISEHRYKLGDFTSYDEAVRACKKFLDNDFNSIIIDCANESDFYSYWAYHGESLYITLTTDETQVFSSKDYINKKIIDYFITEKTFMKNNFKLLKAIKFATKTHEVYQKQKRKGKDISYIVHPLAVGLLLSQSGADEDVVIAGILHDTIEDSVETKKVSTDMIQERFGDSVADLVLSVTETDRELPWDERKKQAIEHIKDFSNSSVLLKSADVIANNMELIDDYARDKDKVFERFNADKTELLKNSLRVISALFMKWPESSLSSNLVFIADQLQMMGATEFMPAHSAKIMEYADYDEDASIECPICLWQGTPKSSDTLDTRDILMTISCPVCDKMLLVINYPLA